MRDFVEILASIMVGGSIGFMLLIALWYLWYDVFKKK